MIDLDKIAEGLHEKAPDPRLKGMPYSQTPETYRAWLREMVGHMMDSMKALGHYVQDRTGE